MHSRGLHNLDRDGDLAAVLGRRLANGAVRYRLLPVFSELLKPDAAMQALIERMRAPHAAAYAEKIAKEHRA